MCLGNVIYKLHDKHGLANACASEKTDLSALCIGADKVNHLDTGLKDLGSGNLILKGRCGTVYGPVGAPNGNYYTGEVAFAPNLAWAAKSAVPLAKKLSDACGVPVSLTNDANAAAVGEMAYGAARGMKNFIMITLGTGVGSGIVVDGKVLYGHDGFAGELGHTSVVRNNGRMCGCGKTGCLEAYCSAIGIARTAREWLEASGQPTPLRELQNITSKDIYDAAKQGDNFSLRLFDYTGTLLGQSFADFVAFSAPEAIVLFGGLARAKEFLYEPMKRAMEDNLLKIWKGKVQIVFSELKESDAAILGASALAWEL